MTSRPAKTRHSFTNDTTLPASHNDPDVLYTSANEYISNVYYLFCSNKLSLNPQTKFMKPSNRRFEATNHNIDILNTCLQRIGRDQLDEGCKFLGVDLDESLSWQHYINYIGKKFSKSLFKMRQVKHILVRKRMKILFLRGCNENSHFCAMYSPSVHVSYVILLYVIHKMCIVFSA